MFSGGGGGGIQALTLGALVATGAASLGGGLAEDALLAGFSSTWTVALTSTKRAGALGTALDGGLAEEALVVVLLTTMTGTASFGGGGGMARRL